MTYRQLVEIIQSSFPEKGEMDLLYRLGQAHQQFAHQTECLLSDFTIPLEADESRYELPTTVAKVLHVDFRDDDDVVQDVQYGHKIENRELVIVELDVSENEWVEITALNPNVTVAYIRGVYCPAMPSVASETPQIAEKFHIALTYPVLSELYALAEKPIAMGLYEGRWKNAIREGKVYARNDATGPLAPAVDDM